jgi:four helix bundle protein
MTQKGKQYDLEERTLNFGKRIVRMTKALPKNTANFEFTSQIIRSGCSVGANYIEANEALGKKDFLMRMRISRKESKETIFWLNLIIENNLTLENRIKPLFQEATELLKILSSIIEKSQNK